MTTRAFRRGFSRGLAGSVGIFPPGVARALSRSKRMPVSHRLIRIRHASTIIDKRLAARINAALHEMREAAAESWAEVERQEQELAGAPQEPR